jgi:hypothetical protein
MISKELLSAVLNGKYDLDLQMSGVKNILFYIDLTLVGSAKYKEINIYELAHKYKEWAETVGDGYSLNSSTTDEYNMTGCEDSRWMCEIVYHPNDIFYANTEPKAIFIACQYILDKQQELKLRMQPTKEGD